MVSPVWQLNVPNPEISMLRLSLGALLCGVVLALASPLGVVAQEVTLQGTVADGAQKPLAGATIYLQQHPRKGAISGEDGQFQLRVQREAVAIDTLVVLYMGLQTVRLALRELDVSKPIAIRMQSNEQQLREVVVRANPSASREFSIREVSRMESYSMPDAAGDALKMVASLPASTNTEESANPELRGSSADMTRVLVNGVPINNPVRSGQIDGTGMFSLLNTELVARQRVYASCPPVVYGNATAGLVDIETPSQLDHRHTALSLALMNLGLMHGEPLGEKSFVQLYGNYQNGAGLVWLNHPERLKGFTGGDVGVNAHWQIAQNTTANLYAYGIDERYRARAYSLGYWGDATASRMRNFNILNLKQRVGNGYVSLNLGSDLSRTQYAHGVLVAAQRNAWGYANLDFTYYPSAAVVVQSGAAFEWSRVHFSNQYPLFYYAQQPDAPSVSFSQTLLNRPLELYAYGSVKVGEKIRLGAGVRGRLPLFGQEAGYSCQGSARYLFTGQHSLLASAGYYTGHSIPQFYTQAFSPIRSLQYTLEYTWGTTITQLQLAAYYKQEFTQAGLREIGGTGQGRTLFDTRKRIFGLEEYFHWVITPQVSFSFSYTFLYAKIRLNGRWYDAHNRMDGLVKGTISYSSGQLGFFSLSGSYHPGLHYTPIVGGIAGHPSADGAYQPVYGELNSGQLGYYLSCNLQWSQLFRLGPVRLITYVSLSNILGRGNQRTPTYKADYSGIQGYNHYMGRVLYVGCMVGW